MLRPDEPRRDRPARAVAMTLVSLLAIAGVFATNQPAHACDCPEPDPPEQAAKDAAAVFAGEVVATTTRGDEPAVADLVSDVEVDEVWRGDVHERVEVATPADQGLCGTDLEDGVSYLFYVRENDGGDFVTDLCMRTTPLEQAQDDLAALDAPDAPLDGDATTDVEGGSEPASDGDGIGGVVIATAGIAVAALSVLAGRWWRRRGATT